MKHVLVLNALFILLPWMETGARKPVLWAATDGVKVDRYDLDHPYKQGNSAWDGDSISLFGALNEMLAFQVIVETGSNPLTIHRAGLNELVHQDSSAYSIRYTAPEIDPTVYTGRPIQVFNIHYMEVKEATQASWIHLPSLPSAIPDPLGWKPVQLVPENANPGKGGYPLAMDPFQNQSIWFEVYLGKDLIAGFYLGRVTVETSEGDFTLPVRLEVLDFTLPDENSLNAMFYFENGNPILYMGPSFDNDPGFHRFAHRHRTEFVHAYDMVSASSNLDRFTGKAFTPENNYEGPGVGTGNIIVPRTFYGTPDEWLNTSTARALSDEWMEFIRDSLPDAITFLYMPDEPGPSEFPFIRSVADNIHNNPGPGKDLKILVTHTYTPDLDGYIDIWATVPALLDPEQVSLEKSKGNQMWFYNGGRPHMGAIIHEAPAMDTRMVAWAAFKEGIGTYFYWHVCHWYHNSQFGPGPDSPLRKQNVWQNTITFERRPQYNDWANGDGVLIYPGRELVHPEEDRGIDGPVSSVRMANFRRGIQDHLYLTLASKRGLDGLVREALDAIVPRAFMEVSGQENIPYELDPDVYASYRYKLGKAISGTDETTGQARDPYPRSTWEIYPNPVRGNQINLRLQAGNPFGVKFELYDLQGRCIGQPIHGRSMHNRMDKVILLGDGKQDLPSGLYLLEVKVRYSHNICETRVFKIVKK